jgi:hypothetical protein
MDDHPGGLVDDEQMIVLEDNFERNVLCDIVRCHGIRNMDLIGLAGLRLGRRIADRASSLVEDTAAADQCLQPFARKRRKRGRQSAVKPPPCRIGSDRRTTIDIPLSTRLPIWG